MKSTLLHLIMLCALLAAAWVVLPRSITRDLHDSVRQWVGFDLHEDGTDVQDQSAAGASLIAPPQTILESPSDLFAEYEDLSLNHAVVLPEMPRDSSHVSPSGTTVEIAGRFYDHTESNSARARSTTSGYRTVGIRDRLYSLRNRTHGTFSRSTVKPDWLRAFGRSLDRSRSGQNTSGYRNTDGYDYSARRRNQY